LTLLCSCAPKRLSLGMIPSGWTILWPKVRGAAQCPF
jgi:hypothetical protein